MICNNRNRDSCMREFYEKQGWQERESSANFTLKL
jgi:hypothetical protein